MRLIDADALDSVVLKLNTEEHAQITRLEYKLIDRVIFEFPTIDAVPVKHGKWITEEGLPGVAVCSICGHEIRGIGCQYTKYCDECGARMVDE